MPKSKSKPKPVDAVEQNRVGFELEALSLLLYHWAKPVVVKKRKGQWGDKMPALRKAIIAGLRTGARRKLEPELIRAEFECLEYAVDYVRSEMSERPHKFDSERSLLDVRIPYPVTKGFVFLRPFPIPEQRVRPNGIIENTLKEVWKSLHNKRTAADSVARKIVCRRFDVCDRTVKDYLKRTEKEEEEENKRAGLSKNQQLLTGIFFDICSDLTDMPKRDKLKAKILNALYFSEPKCHVLLLYYIAQTAHTLQNRIYVGRYEPKAIEDLCNIVCPMAQKMSYLPFLRLLPE